MVTKKTYKHTKVIVLWYVLEEPQLMIKGYEAYARALMEIFPLPFLMLTLVKPWKNIAERKKGHGFNIKEWFERLGFNVFSRAVGAIVRIIAMILGIISHAALLLIFMIYLSFWIAFPAISITAIIFLARQL